MARISCTRRLQFCAGHRVMGHENKCANLHGHNYVVFLTAEAESGLDDVGRVIDFSVLKQWFGLWIDANWDHGFIVFDKDAEALHALSQMEKQKVFEMDSNPTAENMAAFLLKQLAPGLLQESGITLTKVVLWETENCYATVKLDAKEIAAPLPLQPKA